MWDLMLSDEQATIADAIAQFLAQELPIERLRPKAKATDAAAVWRGMAQLGWFGIGIAEEDGGAGLGLVGEMLVQRACGRHLASPSILATMVAVQTALAAGEAALAQALVTGERRAALSLASGVNGAEIPESVPVLALDWMPGDMLLYWDAAGAGLVEAQNLSDLSGDAGLDDSVSLHRCRIERGTIACWVPAEQAPIALRAILLLAARLTGLAEGACVLASEYAKVREQFGKPIGSFQAVKHRCADMLLRAEMSAQLAALACLKLQVGAPDAAQHVAAAKFKAAHAAHENGRAAIQLHGGLGFQAECDAHWFMKRAHIYDQAGGNMQIQANCLFAAPAI